MKSFAFASSAFAALALAQSQAPYPAQVSEIQKFLPTSVIAAQPGFATEGSAAWATLQAKLHSLVAQDPAFFQTYSEGVPGFGGLSALIATEYNTALVTGGGSSTSSSSSSSSSSAASSSPASTSVSDVTPTPSSSSSSIAPTIGSTQSTDPPAEATGSTTSTTATTMTTATSGSTTPSASLSPVTSNGAAQPTSFALVGAAFAGVAGLAVLL